MGPLESLLLSDGKTLCQQRQQEPEILQLPTAHLFLLPNLAVCARCIHTNAVITVLLSLKLMKVNLTYISGSWAQFLYQRKTKGANIKEIQ